MEWLWSVLWALLRVGSVVYVAANASVAVYGAAGPLVRVGGAGVQPSAGKGAVTVSRHKTSVQVVSSRVPGAGARPCTVHLQLSLIWEVRPELTHLQLSYCGQECRRIPPALAAMYGPRVHHLDLSYNALESARGLEQFPALQTLVLDNNRLPDGVDLPRLPRLTTLSLNNNQIKDVERLVDMVAARLPALTFLSLLRNEACPHPLSAATGQVEPQVDSQVDSRVEPQVEPQVDRELEEQYQRYRYYVVYRLPALKFLDARPVSRAERAEARARGAWALVRRPAPVSPVPAADAAPVAQKRASLPPRLDLASVGHHTGAYGRTAYRYTGKHSEGNRFILNSDL